MLIPEKLIRKWGEDPIHFTDLYENKINLEGWVHPLWWVFRVASVHVHLKDVSVLRVLWARRLPINCRGIRSPYYE